MGGVDVLTTPTLSALRLSCAARANTREETEREKVFSIQKEPKTRAIPPRLGQTLLGFRTVRSYRKFPRYFLPFSFKRSTFIYRKFSLTHSALYQHRKRCYGYDNIVYKKKYY
jgi:hypothetical protein